ncbi:MAG: Nif11-like leader peptide family natural product precursor [Lachnospiraceae bacterium]|nr:Nif11-like leader peptide family natural product precursor [Lachnospiraceae bacterium]
MKKSMDKIKEMISDPNLQKTLVRVMNASSPEEIMTIAREDGIALTPEQAQTIFDGKNSDKEISSDDLKEIKKIL